MFMAVTVFYLIVGTLKVWSFDRLFHRHPEPLRGLEASLFKTVLKYSRKQQGQMILLSLLTLPILYLTLELPKQIVNNALDDGRFPIEMLGYSFSQVTLLMMLSGLYLLAISLNGITKYTLNVFKGYVAERFLRRLFVNLRGFPDIAAQKHPTRPPAKPVSIDGSSSSLTHAMHVLPVIGEPRTCWPALRLSALPTPPWL
ncbi:hypothetical protein GGR95_003178 [Sulfitobacter undariae]|uniref:ABC transmembrane type-1 domain-containing protein n=1 Tax=Sulfitobacter undariae TaxID=1563671 RepID=A0A7W6H1T4_9RHOB|nr:hypothetical protein [Sulfitobacter undariae]MBB3995522.1 hypothetical protein [Sulfitobacter undariae]